jgi:hypothetical protein
MRTKLLGNLGAWLCDRYTPRRSTQSEAAMWRDHMLVWDALMKVKNGVCDAKTAIKELNVKRLTQ